MKISSLQENKVGVFGDVHVEFISFRNNNY